MAKPTTRNSMILAKSGWPSSTTARARVALVGIDALMVHRNLVEAARKAIQDKCGIAPDHVLIGASHSHSSGPTGMILPGEYRPRLAAGTAAGLRKIVHAPTPRYLDRVARKSLPAVCQADERPDRRALRRRLGHRG